MTTGNQLAARNDLPPMIRHYGQSLSPRECDEHRAWIGVRVEALLDGYWQSRPSELVKAEILADWMDAMQGYDPSEIRAGCRAYLTGPDCARKPKPGDIVEIMLNARGVALAKHRASLPPQEPEPARFTEEEMAERRRRADEIVGRFARRAGA